MMGIIGKDVPGMIEYIENVSRENGWEQVEQCLHFMLRKHEGQYRSGKGHLPYCSHPLSVCLHALLLGITEEDVLCVCLLHDVVEDCGVKPEELPVNETVRKNVVRLSWPEEDHENCRERYYETIGEDRISCLVKCLDRCHNVSCMPSSYSVKKLRSYSETTRRCVFPLLDRLSDRFGEERISLLLRYQLESVLCGTDRVLKLSERM